MGGGHKGLKGALLNRRRRGPGEGAFEDYDGREKGVEVKEPQGSLDSTWGKGGSTA